MTPSLDLMVNNSLATEGELWKYIGRPKTQALVQLVFNNQSSRLDAL